MLLEAMPEHSAVGKLKQLIGQFYVGLPGAAQLRRDVQHARTAAQQRDIIERFFERFADDQPVDALLDEDPAELEHALVES
jgi:tRNA-dihydrouridine synthase